MTGYQYCILFIFQCSEIRNANRDILINYLKDVLLTTFLKIVAVLAKS